MDDELALGHRLKLDELTFDEWHRNEGRRVRRERANLQRELDDELARIAREVPIKDRWIHEARQRMISGRSLTRLTVFHEGAAQARREQHRAEYAASHWHDSQVLELIKSTEVEPLFDLDARLGL